MHSVAFILIINFTFFEVLSSSLHCLIPFFCLYFGCLILEAFSQISGNLFRYMFIFSDKLEALCAWNVLLTDRSLIAGPFHMRDLYYRY